MRKSAFARENHFKFWRLVKTRYVAREEVRDHIGYEDWGYCLWFTQQPYNKGSVIVRAEASALDVQFILTTFQARYNCLSTTKESMDARVQYAILPSTSEDVCFLLIDRYTLRTMRMLMIPNMNPFRTLPMTPALLQAWYQKTDGKNIRSLGMLSTLLYIGRHTYTMHKAWRAALYAWDSDEFAFYEDLPEFLTILESKDADTTRQITTSLSNPRRLDYFGAVNAFIMQRSIHYIHVSYLAQLRAEFEANGKEPGLLKKRFPIAIALIKYIHDSAPFGTEWVPIVANPKKLNLPPRVSLPDNREMHAYLYQMCFATDILDPKFCRMVLYNITIESPRDINATSEYMTKAASNMVKDDERLCDYDTKCVRLIDTALPVKPARGPDYLWTANSFATFLQALEYGVKRVKRSTRVLRRIQGCVRNAQGLWDIQGTLRLGNPVAYAYKHVDTPVYVNNDNEFVYMDECLLVESVHMKNKNLTMEQAYYYELARDPAYYGHHG
jgi:hypothetical protein